MSLIPDPKVKCEVLWHLTVKDFFRLGFGAAMSEFEPLRAYVEYSGCKLVVSESLAADWQTWALGPFWSAALSEQKWQARWNAAPKCGFIFVGTHVKCKGPFGFLTQAGWTRFVKGPAFNGPGPPTGVFRAAYDLGLQTFGPRLSQYRTPFRGRFAAIYVTDEHGMSASRNVDLVRSWWPHLDRIFVATSNMAVVSDVRSSIGAGIELAWTHNQEEHVHQKTKAASGIRGSDKTAKTDGAVAALLDDIAGLASASVVVGTSKSPIFNVARALNLHLHLTVARSHPWCYDVHQSRICD